MTTASEATQLIHGHMRPWPPQTVTIDQCLDRVLAEEIRAERDVPAFDRVTMDGIAIAHSPRAAQERRFAIAGTQPAGVAPLTITGPDQCVRVMTGAVLPRGTDTVVPVERLTLTHDTAVIEAGTELERGQFVHRQGSDRRAGSVVLDAGTRIGPPEIAVLASVGRSTLAVSRIPRIAVISTGDELVGVDEPVAPHQIRSSNGRAIEAALLRHRCAEVTRRRLRDEPDDLLAALDALHASHDVLILSGGVSMGDFDFVPGALKHLGAELVFHRIEQKPGRPMWFGVSASGKPIFALPGNPVSTLVCMTRYVIPALLAALGAPPHAEYARLAETAADGPREWTWFVPVTVTSLADGTSLAKSHAINTSGDFSSLAGTDGIAELDAGEANRSAGAVVRVFRW
jgi:molybdopterin molybdotransferase